MKWIQKIRSTWEERPGSCFIITVVTLSGLFLLVYRDELLGRLLGPWVEWTARMTAYLLQLSGMEALRAGALIHHPAGFAYEIYYRCTAILPMALLAIFIAAAPAPVRRKFAGLAVGIPALVLVNLLRLVHLFHTGVYHPAWFAPAHEVIWEIVLVAAMLGLWWVWRRWAVGPPPGRPQDKPADKLPQAEVA